MKNKIFVFDFDKTLTYKDTLLGFYFFSSKKNIAFFFKTFIYFFFMILRKMGLITNDFLKEVGVTFFLKGKSISEIQEKSNAYSSKIKLNKLYKDFDFNNKEIKIIIISASFYSYLRPLFPENVLVYGSELKTVNNFVKGLNFNCYSFRKRELLKSVEIEKIDTLYTDSIADFPLVEISEEIFLVKNDELIRCSNAREFKIYNNT